jgi:hypothetical protein
VVSEVKEEVAEDEGSTEEEEDSEVMDIGDEDVVGQEVVRDKNALMSRTILS